MKICKYKCILVFVFVFVVHRMDKNKSWLQPIPFFFLPIMYILYENWNCAMIATILFFPLSDEFALRLLFFVCVMSKIDHIIIINITKVRF